MTTTTVKATDPTDFIATAMAKSNGLRLSYSRSIYTLSGKGWAIDLCPRSGGIYRQDESAPNLKPFVPADWMLSDCVEAAVLIERGLT